MSKLGAIAKALFVASLLAVTTAGAMPLIEGAPSDLASTEAWSEVGLLAPRNCTYYSNPFHTTVVGQFGYDCCNNPVAWGVKTPYSVCGGCFPCFPPPQ